MLYTIAFEKVLTGVRVPFLKTARNSLALLAAGVVMSGVAQAQDQTTLSHQTVPTNSTASLALPTNTLPTVTWRSQTQASGLIVDLIKPQQTWAMLNPPREAGDVSIPTNRPPAKAPLIVNDNLGVRETDFAWFSFNF